MVKIAYLTWIEWKLYFRNIFKAFSSLAIPVMLLILMGGIYGNKPVINGFGILDMTIAGYIGIAIAFTGLMSLPVSICQYREKKVLKRFMATPIHPADLLASQVAVNYLVTLLGMAVLILTGLQFYHVRMPGNPAAIFLSFTTATICIFSIGFVIASLCEDMKTANAVSFLLYFPMLMLSGATIPLDVMPPVMKHIAEVLPLTYGIDLIRGAWLGGSNVNFMKDMAVLGGTTVAAVMISFFTFRWE